MFLILYFGLYLSKVFNVFVSNIAYQEISVIFWTWHIFINSTKNFYPLHTRAVLFWVFFGGGYLLLFYEYHQPDFRNIWDFEFDWTESFYNGYKLIYSSNPCFSFIDRKVFRPGLVFSFLSQKGVYLYFFKSRHASNDTGYPIKWCLVVGSSSLCSRRQQSCYWSWWQESQGETISMGFSWR